MRSEKVYLRHLLDALAVCSEYRPKLGHRAEDGYTLEAFRELYGSDPFYSWLGLDSPSVYAALRASGGITSLYRQIGIGCERLFRAIIQDQLQLSEEESSWSYTVREGNRTRELKLDARIRVAAISDEEKRETVLLWIARACDFLGLATEQADNLGGMVFEVRQGYKSKDSKRQNADIQNATNAFAHSYMMVIPVFSMQIDEDLLDRYRAHKMLVLTGTLRDDDIASTYAFSRSVLGYDLAGFFQRNADHLRAEIREILGRLVQ